MSFAFVAPDGARLHYRARGSGPLVFLVHGGTATGTHDWGTLARALARRHRAVTPDLRGHGRSDDPAGLLSIDQIGDDLRLLADEVGRPAAVVAFSIGAAAVVRLLGREPRFTDAAILVGAALAGSGERARAIARGPWPRDLVGLRHVHGRGPDHWRGLRATLAASWSERPAPSDRELRALALPVLVACGDRDPVFSVSDARRLAATLPAGELLVVPAAGHAVMRERPLEFGVAARAFLDRALPEPRPRSLVHKRSIG